MKYFIKNESTSSNNFIHLYSSISKNDLDKKLDELLSSSGYKMKEGKIGNSTYVKGSRVLRLLFGAFVKYFKFNIITTSLNSNEIRVEVNKTTTGMSGGVIGVSQVKKELKQLEELLKTI